MRTLGASIRTARRTLPLIIGAACLALALTGCSGEDGPAHARQTPSASTAPKPAPALSTAQARDVITRYSKINNEANADRDRRLLDTVEDGPLYAMSVSDYTETEGLPAKDREPYEAWSYDLASAKLYIPRLADGQEGWFAAALSSEKGKAPSRLAVFAEQSQHKRWEMVSVVDLDSQKLPDVALDREDTRRPSPPTTTSSWPPTPTCSVLPCWTTSPPEARTPEARCSRRPRPASGR